jgi:hypothetical protein
MRLWVESDSVRSVVSGDILKDLVRVGVIDRELSPSPAV